MALMKAALFTALGALCLSPLPAAAQVTLSVAEGAACAQSAATIETLEKYNADLYDEIGDAQASPDRKQANMANALLLHYARMVALRQGMITDYEVICARASMSYADMRKVCTPFPSGKSFADTVFCKPLKEAWP